jgi:hypothetical protein
VASQYRYRNAGCPNRRGQCQRFCISTGRRYGRCVGEYGRKCACSNVFAGGMQVGVNPRYGDAGYNRYQGGGNGYDNGYGNGYGRDGGYSTGYYNGYNRNVEGNNNQDGQEVIIIRNNNNNI